MNFESFNLSQPVLDGIRDAGFTEPTKVQVESLKHSLAGRDVTVQSQTGTGKTAAFLISIFELLTRNERFQGRKALVVAPTRELAVQIEDEANLLGKHVGLRAACFYGGVGYGKQEQAVADGVDLIIGTPGRLLDFKQSGKLDFRQVGICVIDEADRLFDMGFYPDIKRIMKGLVDRTERLTMLYSATLSIRVLNIAWEYMNDPAEVEIEPEHVTVEAVEQKVLHVGREEKMRALIGIIEKEQPETCLVFSNTKTGAEQVAKRLEMNGYSARFIMGDLPQRKRLQIIEGMKEGKTRFLVATDVAARGLHINNLDLVVNYDVPEDSESYVHRIGRTARAGQTGRAYTLACERYVFGLEPIEELIGMKIPVERVDEFVEVEDKSEGVHIRTGSARVPASSGRSERGGRSKSRPARGGKDRRSKPERTHGVRAAEPHGPSGGKRGGEDHPDHKSNRKRKDAPRSTRPHEANRTTAKNATGHDYGTPGRDASLDERLEHYRRKYGEDFVPKETAGESPVGEDRGSPAVGTRSDRSTRRTRGGKRRSGGKSDKLPQKRETGEGERRGADGRENGARNNNRSAEAADSGTVEQSKEGSDRGIVSRLRRLFGRR